jgi:FMN phosphatase YigB (HAD superfamily)
VKPERSVFVGSDLANEIAPANATKMITARIKTGAHRTSTPKAVDEKPAFEISKLSDILVIVGRGH